jgi:dipeptidyl aminopeptidase/acylaminoacyl peptidase
MQRPRPLFLTLGFIAFAGWILFILACTGWPAWSPDGKQIAFPYHDLKSDGTGVALYDREQKATGLYLTQDNDTLATAQWSQDGKQILFYRIFGEDGRFATEVLAIPVKNKYPIRSFGVTSKVMGDMPPLAEVRGTVYFALDGITALDLNTWSTQHESISGFGLILYSMGDRLMYIAVPREEEEQKSGTADTNRQVSGQKPAEKTGAEKAEKKEEPPMPYEFGEVDLKDFSRHAWFTITDRQIAEAAQCKGGDLVTPPAVHASTERMAFTATCDDRADAILVLGRSGVQEVIRPKTTDQFQLTNPQWSADGRSLYAGLYVHGEKEKGTYSVAEIALDTQALRLTPITRLGVSSGDYSGAMQVSLSPDGSLLATNTALLGSEGDVARDDMALYIMDLRDPKRSVTRIHPPNWEPKPPEEPKPAAEKKTP